MWPPILDCAMAISTLRLYGPNSMNASHFAEMAYVFQDKDSARQAFTYIDSREPSVWLTQERCDSARAWATGP